MSSNPSSNADTEVIGPEHRPLTDRELRRVVERHARAQEYLEGHLLARRAALRWLAPPEDAD